jgi:hypothetical protein
MIDGDGAEALGRGGSYLISPDEGPAGVAVEKDHGATVSWTFVDVVDAKRFARSGLNRNRSEMRLEGIVNDVA